MLYLPNFTSAVFTSIVNRYTRAYFIDTRLESEVETPLGTYTKVSEVYRLKIDPVYVTYKPETLTIMLTSNAPSLVNFLHKA